MMELQAHHQGNMPGLQLYGSRCNPYTFPITRIPRPMFLDTLHSRQQNNACSRERLQAAWASSGHKSNAEGKAAQHNQTVQSTPSKQTKPYVTWAAFPNDIPRLVEIEFAAFQDEIVNHQLSYRDSTNPEHTSRTIDFYRHCMQHMRHNALPGFFDAVQQDHPPTRTDSKLDLTLPFNNPASMTTKEIDPNTQGYRFRKVLDPQTNEIIAFAKSEITALTPEDHASPLDVGHENEPEMNRAWFALNERLHRAYCGQRQHLYFGMLATHPSHQHRGAATALMSELVAEADALGLEIYCEATKTGRPLYEKYGFVPVKTLVFDPAEFGVLGLGVEVQTVMVRGALGGDGVRREVGGLELEEV